MICDCGFGLFACPCERAKLEQLLKTNPEWTMTVAQMFLYSLTSLVQHCFYSTVAGVLAIDLYTSFSSCFRLLLRTCRVSFWTCKARTTSQTNLDWTMTATQMFMSSVTSIAQHCFYSTAACESHGFVFILFFIASRLAVSNCQTNLCGQEFISAVKITSHYFI